MRKTFRNLHLVIGLVGAVYMLLMAGTGTVLALREPILRLAIPGLDAPAPVLAPMAAGRVLATLEARYGADGLRSVRLPYDGMKAYRLYLADRRELLLDADTLAPVHDPFAVDRTLRALFALHHRLALGETGKAIVGLLGLASVFLVLSGLYLWWPWRRGFRLSRVRALGGGAAAERRAHATFGILIALPLFLSVLTGTAMIYSGPVRAGLSALLGGARPVVEQTRAAGVGDDASRLFAYAKRSLPGAVPGIYRPARHAMRFRMPGEWHPNGRSTVTLTAAGAVIYDATQAGAGQRVADAIYPVHSGRLGGGFWRGFVAATGFATLYLMAKALMAFYRRYRPVRR